MRAVIQRVLDAKVSIENKLVSEIGTGLLVFVGIEMEDNEDDSLWLANKVSSLRIFSDKNGLMNNSVREVGGEVIVVSQFTLYAKTKKGNRPSFFGAANQEKAIILYEKFKRDLSNLMDKKIYSGEFGANMKVSLTNNGPVTIIIDTKRKE